MFDFESTKRRQSSMRFLVLNVKCKHTIFFFLFWNLNCDKKLIFVNFIKAKWAVTGNKSITCGNERSKKKCLKAKLKLYNKHCTGRLWPEIRHLNRRKPDARRYSLFDLSMRKQEEKIVFVFSHEKSLIYLNPYCRWFFH
jgi:hypothetical protein